MGRCGVVSLGQTVLDTRYAAPRPILGQCGRVNVLAAPWSDSTGGRRAARFYV